MPIESLDSVGFLDLKKKQHTFKNQFTPGRPQSLEFSHKRKKRKFPSIEELENESSRALIFHFLANHELLALELMALLLLKFPNSPWAFRKGIAYTMLEEQKHLRLYISRMSELGMDFGEVGVNDYFWKILSPMNSPEEFIAGMSLTFEQCNLDFSKIYLDRFAELQDESSRQIMETVYLEEIGHVKHGVDWFQKLTNPQSEDQDFDMWQEFLNVLPEPLTPARAKGSFFDRGARENAGLSKEYLDQLELFTHSKGKSPDLYFFNPTCDIEDQNNFTSPKALIEVQQDLEPAFLIMGGHDDITVTQSEISIDHLLYLKRKNLSRTQLVSTKGLSDLKNRKLKTLKSWGPSQKAISFFNSQLSHLETPNTFDCEKSLYPKSFHSSFFENFNNENLAFKNFCTTTPLLNFVDPKEYVEWIIKPNLGSAGRGIKVINQQELSELDLKNFKGQLEPFHQNLGDFSLLFHRDDQNKWQTSGITRFHTSSKGEYKSTLIGDFDHNLEVDQLQFIHQKLEKSTLFKEISQEWSHFLNNHYSHLETSYLGIDLLLTSQKGLLKLHYCEVNPRMTFGHLALEYKKRLMNKSPLMLKILNKKEYLGLYNTPSKNSLIFITDPQKIKRKGVLIDFV